MKLNIKFDILIILLFILYSVPAFSLDQEIPCSNDNHNFKKYNSQINEIDIKIFKLKKWYKNIFEIYKSFQTNDNIDKDFKKNFDGELKVKYSDGSVCFHKAKVRVSGLSLFHFSKDSYSTSLQVRLIDGHINNITKFRLLLPESRVNDNEIFVSSLLKYFGLVMRDTRYVDVVLNEKKQKFIFQENLSKELLENNSLREGPIFVFSNKHQNYDLLKLPSLKVENSSWVKNDIEKFYDTSEGLAALADLFDINNNIKHFNTKKIKKNTSEFKIFNTLFLTTNSTHGLSIYNMALYYDPILKIFKPILNDPKSNILNKNIAHQENFIQIMDRWSILETSPIITLNKLNEINLYDFKKDLENKNLYLSDEKISSTFEIIKKNLKFLISYNENNRINESQQKLASNFYDKYKNTFNYIILENRDGLNFLKCENLNSCNAEDVKKLFYYKENNFDTNKIIFSKILKQEFVDSNNFYLGSKNLKNNYINYKHKIFNVSYFFKNFEILINNGVKINSVDYKNKIINITQTDANGKIIFTGKKIENWKINFQGLGNKSNINNFRNLTGCITFIDIQINDISIKTSDGICEDTVNFIRASGKVKKFESKNSASDSLDNDFSKIIFEEILIDNSRNDCLDFSFGEYVVLSGTFNKCGDKAISVGENSKVNLNDLNIKNSNIGIATKDNSKTQIYNAEIQNVFICMAAYKKKQEFSGGFIIANNVNCNDFVKKTQIDNFSEIIINDKL